MKENKISLGVIVALCLTTTSSFAFDRSQEMRNQVIIAGEDGAAIRPHVAKLVPHGALILAGDISASRKGWAAKLNADHTVAWTYTAALGADDQNSELRNTLTGPQFNDVVSIPDGTFFLCGKMPHPARSVKSTALLTHLDQQGRLIAEHLIDIEGAAENRLRFSIAACALFKGGIVALAHESHFPPPGAKPEATASFALLLLDHDGNIRSTRRFNFSDATFTPVSNGSSLLMLNDAFVAVFTDNVNTEVATFSFDGNPIARKKLKGRFIAVKESGGELARLYGSFEAGGAGRKTTVTFNRALNEVAQASGDKPTSFVPELVFGLPGHAFAMFGTQINAHGDRLTSSARWVNEGLGEERFIDFPKHEFFDGGTVSAASPTARQGEFAIARSYAPEGASPAVQRGVVVNFLNF